MRERRLFSWLATIAMLGCSSGTGSDASGADAGKDGAGVDVVTDASESGVDTTLPDACGSPPYFTYTMKVGEIAVGGGTSALSGATLTFDLCPELSVTTGTGGSASVSVQRGAAFTATVAATGHITVIAGEELVGVDDPLTIDHFVELLPTTSSAVIPGYSADAPSFAVVIQADGISGSPCNTSINVHFDPPAGVTAHYMLPGWPADVAELATDASVGPVVFFTGLTGTETTVPPSTTGGSEAACKAIDHGPPTHQTGRFKLAPGAWTVADVARVN
jgi:hypothetical protein